MRPSPWVVIPTYNESENLQPLIQSIRRYFSGQLLVVDDNSPDGTGRSADELRRTDPGLQVHHRQSKQGLAAAYRDGLRVALDSGATEIVHCDADLSHPPDLIPQLLAALQAADLAIASRYIQGGKLDIPVHRRLVSQFGNHYIRALLGRSIHDWSSGFCGWRRATLEAALMKSQTTVGYAWLIEMKFRALKNRATVTELPLRFTDRRAGHSKFSWAIMWEDVATAWRLRFGG